MKISILTLLVTFAANTSFSIGFSDRIESITSVSVAQLENPFESSALVVTRSISPTDVNEWKAMILRGLKASEKEPSFSGVAGYLICNSQSDVFAVSVIEDSGIVRVHEVEASGDKYSIINSKPIKRGRKHLSNMDLLEKIRVILPRRSSNAK